MRRVPLEVDRMLFMGELEPPAPARQPSRIDQIVVFQESGEDAGDFVPPNLTGLGRSATACHSAPAVPYQSSCYLERGNGYHLRDASASAGGQPASGGQSLQLIHVDLVEARSSDSATWKEKVEGRREGNVSKKIAWQCVACGFFLAEEADLPFRKAIGVGRDGKNFKEPDTIGGCWMYTSTVRKAKTEIPASVLQFGRLGPGVFRKRFLYTSQVWLLRTTCEPWFTPPVEL